MEINESEYFSMLPSTVILESSSSISIQVLHGVMVLLCVSWVSKLGALVCDPCSVQNDILLSRLVEQ